MRTSPTYLNKVTWIVNKSETSVLKKEEKLELDQNDYGLKLKIEKKVELMSGDGAQGRFLKSEKRTLADLLLNLWSARKSTRRRREELLPPLLQEQKKRYLLKRCMLAWKGLRVEN